MYSTDDISRFFNKSATTVRNRTTEFGRWLSSGVTPTGGQHRRFTDDDLEVLALIAQMKDEGKTYDDIHTSLAERKRGIVPDILDAQDVETMRIILQRYEHTITSLRNDLTEAQARLRPLEHDVVRLEAQLELTQQQQLETQQALREALKEVGRVYHQGYISHYPWILPRENNGHKSGNA